MTNTIKGFFDKYDECFSEYVSDLFVNLNKTNSIYQNIQREISKTLNNFPRIREIIEDNKSYGLSKEEVMALAKYLSLLDDKRIIEEKELFFKGGGEAYYYFKKMGIIKD